MKTIPVSSLVKATRTAGISYILIIALGVLKVNLLEPAIIMDPGNGPAGNLAANEMLFRFGIAIEIIMFILVVVLSLALYIILKPVSKNLALTALFLRFGEAVIGGIVTILSGLIPLLLIEGETSFQKEQMQALVETFLNVRVAGLNVVLIFVGLGGSVFFYLFYRSRFVPRVLSAWGIFTYVSMFFLGFLNILNPDRPDLIEVFLFSAGGLFEFIFGFWLLLKGLNTDYLKKFHPAESAAGRQNQHVGV